VKETPALVLLCARLKGRDEAVRLYGTEASALLDAEDERARAGFRALTA
jgi:hypothetical protein